MPEIDAVGLLIGAMKYGTPSVLAGALLLALARWMFILALREITRQIHEVARECSPTITIRVAGPVPVYMVPPPEPVAVAREATDERAA